jgi:ABC-type multidrug transport system fused ATPase/permease subunit
MRRVLTRVGIISAGAAMATLSEALAAVRTVVVFAQEPREHRKYDELLLKAYELSKRAAVFQGTAEGAARMSINLGTLALLSYGGHLVLAGQLTIGTLLAFNVYNLFIGSGLGSISSSLAELTKASGAVKRVFDMMPVEEEHGEQPKGGVAHNRRTEGRAEGRVCLDEVTFTYPGKTQPALRSVSATNCNELSKHSCARESISLLRRVVGALAGVRRRHTRVVNSLGWLFNSLKARGREVCISQPTDYVLSCQVSVEAEPGRTVALVGPSGSGKSSVVELLLCNHAHQSGEVRLDGAAMAAWEPRWVRRQVALVSQSPALFSGTVADNIRYSNPTATMAEVEAAARAANAYDFITRLPGGFDAPVGPRGGNLSGGQRQRLAIARAVLKDAPVLVLDEATSALDAETEASVMRSLRRDGAKRTTIIIAHRLSTVKDVDSILVLDGGEVKERGTHDELLERQGLYARMVQRGGTFSVDEGPRSSRDEASRENDDATLAPS